MNLIPWIVYGWLMFSLGFVVAAILRASGKDADTYENHWDARSTDTSLDMP